MLFLSITLKTTYFLPFFFKWINLLLSPFTEGQHLFLYFVYDVTTIDNRILQSLWWFRTKGGFFLFLFFYVPFLYLVCFWFCSCWIDLHMCCRQSSGLHAHTHVWCIYQWDPLPHSACIPANKIPLSFENLAYWCVFLQGKTNQNKIKTATKPNKSKQ